MLERRKKRRFPVAQPVSLAVRAGDACTEVHGISENVSEIGILISTDALIMLEAEVEITVSLPHGVRVSAPGRVVRFHATISGRTFGIECSRPFSCDTQDDAESVNPRDTAMTIEKVLFRN